MKNTNENILKLRELSDKICKNNLDDVEYSIVIKKLKDIVEESEFKAKHSLTPNSKVRTYEKMCLTITNLLTNIKFI